MNPKQTLLLAGLVAKNVEFAVVGGVAVIAYGYVRATSDIDIFIRPTLENAQKVYDVLATLNFPVKQFGPSDLLLEGETIRFGPPENNIDILPTIGKMPFDQVWRNRVQAKVGELLIPFISKADLIANKREGGWLRHLSDAEELSARRDVVFPSSDL